MADVGAKLRDGAGVHNSDEIVWSCRGHWLVAISCECLTYLYSHTVSSFV